MIEPTQRDAVWHVVPIPADLLLFSPDIDISIYTLADGPFLVVSFGDRLNVLTFANVWEMVEAMGKAFQAIRAAAEVTND